MYCFLKEVSWKYVMAVFEYFKYILNTIHLRKANSPYITAASDKLQLLALPSYFCTGQAILFYIMLLIKVKTIQQPLNTFLLKIFVSSLQL